MKIRAVLPIMLLFGSLPVLAQEEPAAASSGNPSNDKLLSMPEYGQAAMLSKAAHYKCIGEKPFYMGTEKEGANKNVSFWSITCKNGGSEHMIAISPDETGNTKIYPCTMLHGDPWTCYEKLKEKD